MKKSLPVEMGKIDHHPQAVHLLDHRYAKAGKLPFRVMLPYTIAQLVTEVPGKLHRTETDSIEVPELVNAPLKRSGALEVEDKGDIAWTNPVGQVGSVFDKGNHPL
jgi:hypothetical protein